MVTISLGADFSIPEVPQLYGPIDAASQFEYHTSFGEGAPTWAFLWDSVEIADPKSENEVAAELR